jgi:hypothetical protein
MDASKSFCAWRTLNKTVILNQRRKVMINSFRLPREEYSARGGLESSNLSLGGPYTKKEVVSCKFQTKQGDYAADQALYTVEEVI